MMINTTLTYLLRANSTRSLEVCLGMKKRGFGENKYNGFGGKIESTDKSPLEAAKREVFEEAGIENMTLVPKGIIIFHYLHKPQKDQITHVFTSKEWEGEIIESEEMRPVWFPISNIPLDQMWIDDKYWLQHVIDGMSVNGEFIFQDYDTINSIKLEFNRHES